MNDSAHRPPEASDGNDQRDAPIDERARLGFRAAAATARTARLMSLAVPFRALERNRRVAASVLAGGIAYRVFLWLLPFGLILGGALGLMNADGVEEAIAVGGVPAVVVDLIGDVARAAESDWWWLLGIGVPLLLWTGYTGAKAVQLIHSLIWDEPPPRTRRLRTSLAFTGVLCAVMAVVVLTWSLREESWSVGLLAATLTIAPLTGLWVWVSLRLPHGDARWQRSATRSPRHCDRVPGAPRVDRHLSRAEAREGDGAVRRAGRHDDAPLLHVPGRKARRHRARSQQLAPCGDPQSASGRLARQGSAGTADGDRTIRQPSARSGRNGPHRTSPSAPSPRRSPAGDP